MSRKDINERNPQLGKFNAPLAQREKFRDELVPGFGSAFLINEREVLTAGHCVCVEGEKSILEPRVVLDSMRIVFNYHQNDPHTQKTTFEDKDVYRIKKVKFYKLEEVITKDGKEKCDWALIKLDRFVIGIKPIELDLCASKGRHVYTLGCPTGMAVKSSGIDYSQIKGVTQGNLESDSDIFGGNSGCPLIDRITHKAIGIVVRGPTDYEIDEEHEKSTGHRQVISFRVTQQRLAAGYGYTKSQRITIAMVKGHEGIAQEGRQLRREMSDASSLEFGGNYQRRIDSNFEKLQSKNIKNGILTIVNLTIGVLFPPLIPIVIALSLGEKVKNEREFEQELEQFKKVAQIADKFKLKVNFKEAYELMHSQQPNDSEAEVKMKRKIARNTCAYNLDASGGIEQYGASLYEIEVTKFKRMFSPEKVFDLMTYAKIKGFDFSDQQMGNILKRMQKLNPEHHMLKKTIEERCAQTEIAHIKAKVKEIKKSDTKYLNVSEVILENAATHYVNEKLTEEQMYALIH